MDRSSDNSTRRKSMFSLSRFLSFFLPFLVSFFLYFFFPICFTLFPFFLSISFSSFLSFFFPLVSLSHIYSFSLSLFHSLFLCYFLSFCLSHSLFLTFSLPFSLSLSLSLFVSISLFTFLSLSLSISLSLLSLRFYKGFRPYVLALCGASGTCKSTAVELLCVELNTELKVWTEDSWDPGSSSGKFKEYSVENGSFQNFSRNTSQRYRIYFNDCVLYRSFFCS